MWYKKSLTVQDWSAATKELSKSDPVMRATIKKVGACTLVPRRDYFNLLCISIFNQQISTKVAAVLYARFRDQFPKRSPTPAKVLEFLRGDEELIRKCGISRQKKGYLEHLAQCFVEKKIPTRKFAKMSDDEVIELLTQVKGIGRWTAEMFLMFVLNRPDILPADDLGLQEAIKRAYAMKDRPKPKAVTEFGERWRPWRTVATWYLWRGLED